MSSVKFKGQGTTKFVFEAYDRDLNRKVAIYVPRKVDKSTKKEIEIH